MTKEKESRLLLKEKEYTKIREEIIKRFDVKIDNLKMQPVISFDEEKKVLVRIKENLIDILTDNTAANPIEELMNREISVQMVIGKMTNFLFNGEE